MILNTTTEQIQYFTDIVPKEITKTRWEHSLRVAEIAEELASIHSPNETNEAYLAGVVHDITKQKTKEFHLDLFTKLGDLEAPKLPEAAWHSRSAAYYLETEYGLKTRSVLDAVKHHTLGGEDLNLLDCILYAADFLGSEFAERQKDYSDWRNKAKENLYLAVLNKTVHTMQNLLNNKGAIHNRTIAMYHFALGKLSN
ncbi:bis(5'-nucleosyl)-tetraphosphatase (symmetrical) YqeK [Leptospira sp. WS58.C1]|uniref:bis(5'-nucleosyl)-tetraphosphatase (symmetrical) YqeK n=1 Tax=Leptospira TaxID=171 RepID=UPI0002BF8958|nr:MULTISPECIES: bis(5'-nucleosyl)-tetraphosphatase (symmetrical) YqeK [unclassified Leptospira]EMJ97154.1 hydrolase, HD family [Leptospira sp. B5-022]MCR1792797.1 bis(5'-nucleosyl)-tetraphosphatase (symmetrical) YqeK [Leptospira sp. id769339]